MAIGVINYATGPRRREMPFTVLHMTIWLSAVSLISIWVGCFAIPKFELIFRDFHSDLPLMTQVVLTASRWCRNDFGWIALLLLPAMPICFDCMSGRHWAIDGVPRRTRILFGLFIVLAAAGFLLIVYSLFAPMVALGGGVSSPKALSAPAAH